MECFFYPHRRTVLKIVFSKVEETIRRDSMFGMKKLRGAAVIAILSIAVVGCAAQMKDKMAFSGPGSVAYSKVLWKAMANANLVGKNMIRTKPYEGKEPHGAILETLDTKITVQGHSGWVVVKRNYGPKGIDEDDVVANPAKHLKAVTVMFKREKGYDTENKDWFWAKYKADGSLDKNPKGMQLAGRVAKGKKKGCIACHSGGDSNMNVTGRTAL
jgi:hypothetical protein